jgi:F420-non-reducing hydrogenase small subunit
MISALGSVLDLGDYKGITEQQVAEKTSAAMAGLPDPAGVFYRYSLAGSIWGSK